MTDEVTDALPEQAVTPAPAEPQSPEPADTSAPEADDSAPSDPGTDPAAEPPRKRGGFQNRIDKLTREKYEADLRTQQLQRELEDLRAKHTPSDPGPKPALQQFQSLDEYEAAFERWATARGKAEGHKEAEEKTRQEKELEGVRSTAAAFAAREDQARERYADYNQAVAPLDPLVRSNPTLARYLATSEAGPDVAYHLARNPDALAAVLRGDPVSAVRELTKIELRLASPPPPKPTTQAPAPVQPVGARATAPTTMADLAESDDAAAYIARRNAQGRKT